VSVALAKQPPHASLEPGSVASALEIAADLSNVGQSAAAARIMRKDAGLSDGELPEDHSMESPGRSRKQGVEESPCDRCTVNVQIATTNMPALSEDTKTPSVAYKTMQIQACVDKEKPNSGFHFAGCTTSGDAADICVHSQNEQGGVRLLKDRRGHVVGYGSCCSDALVDLISQVSVMHCEAPAKIDLNLGAHKEEEASSSSEGAQMSKDAILANPEVLKAAGAELINHSWGGIWDAWPENATNAEEDLVVMPWRLETIIIMLVCFSISMAATISSVWLMTWHLRLGSRITGSIFKLHPSSAAAIGLLWPIPIFSILGFVTLMLPELTVVWQFLEALLVAATLRKMPDVFLQTVGGQLQLQLQSRAREEATREALPIFTQWPFCCMRRCVRPKVPEVQDVSRLHWIVVLLCFALPVLSFMEMFFALEVVMGPPATQIHLTNVSPVIMTSIRCFQALCLSLGMASVTGLELVVTALSPKASKDMCLEFKSLYCQTLVGGTRLLPLICSLAPLWGLGPLREGHGASATRGAIVSAAAVLCGVIGWRAFPADKNHYLQAAASGSSENSASSETASCKQNDMKPVLDQVRYCPFCGFSELELEASQALADCALCPRCRAHNVPVHLVVRRGGPEQLPTKGGEASVGSNAESLGN
jgi:hypothetical protein